MPRVIYTTPPSPRPPRSPSPPPPAARPPARSAKEARKASKAAAAKQRKVNRQLEAAGLGEWFDPRSCRDLRKYGLSAKSGDYFVLARRRNGAERLVPIDFKPPPGMSVCRSFYCFIVYVGKQERKWCKEDLDPKTVQDVHALEAYRQKHRNLFSMVRYTQDRFALVFDLANSGLAEAPSIYLRMKKHERKDMSGRIVREIHRVVRGHGPSS